MRSSKRISRVPALVLALGLALPAAAQAEGMQSLYAGVNGIVNGVTELPAQVIWPSDDYEDVPLYPVTGRLLGVVSGTAMTAYRLSMGVVDILLWPTWVAPPYSPEPRFSVFPEDWEIEYSE